MKTKTYFTFRVDVWDSAANSIVEHIAGIDDFEVAQATYWAAVARWRITLRQGIRVVHDTRQATRYSRSACVCHWGALSLTRLGKDFRAAAA
jgi:predicted kinase